MRNEQHRHLPLELVDGSRKVFRRLLIQIGDRLVEDQNLRSLEQRPGDGNPLPLPTRQAGAALADLRLISVIERFDDFMDFRRLAGLNHIFKAGMRVGHDQVVVERTGEEHGFLGHDAEGIPEFVGGEMADVLAVKIDLAFVGLVEAEQQFGQGALSAAGRPHEHREVAGFQA